MKKNSILCPHFKKCSGCQIDEDITNFPLYQESKVFFKTLGIHDFKLNSGNATKWRCRAKLAVRGTFLNPSIGLYEEGSHNVVDIPLCQVHHPLINQAVAIIIQWIKDEKIEPYDEKKRNGFLRYVQLTIERDTNRVQLVFVINEKEENFKFSNGQTQALNAIWSAVPNFWHSIWINFNPAKNNVILSPRWHLFKGDEWLVETICKKVVYYHPGSFIQANLEMFEQLINRLKSFIVEGSNLLEYYAGVGAIGIALIDKCRSVVCVERSTTTKMCFEESKKHLLLEEQSKISFINKASESALDLLDKDFDVIVADPPRKGMEKSILKKICDIKEKKRLIYISCGFDSFKRDCKALIDSGWKLVFAESFLFFPGSEHLEVLAVFDK